MSCKLKYNHTLAALAALGMVAVGSTSAFARCSPGEIANLLCQTGVINKPTANTADRIHAAAGRPLDHAANQAAGAVVGAVGGPVAGAYVTQGLELRDQYRRSMANGAPYPQAGQPTNYQPMNYQTMGYRPAMLPYPAPRYGVLCATQFGAFGPFPANYVGASCAVATAYGPVYGQVI